MYYILHYSEYSDCTLILTATKSRGGEVVYAPANAKNQIDLLNHVISNDKKSFLESDKSPIMALKILLLLLDAVKLVLPWSCLLIEFNLLMILAFSRCLFNFRSLI